MRLQHHQARGIAQCNHRDKIYRGLVSRHRYEGRGEDRDGR